MQHQVLGNPLALFLGVDACRYACTPSKPAPTGSALWVSVDACASLPNNCSWAFVPGLWWQCSGCSPWPPTLLPKHDWFMFCSELFEVFGACHPSWGRLGAMLSVPLAHSRQLYPARHTRHLNFWKLFMYHVGVPQQGHNCGALVEEAFCWHRRTSWNQQVGATRLRGCLFAVLTSDSMFLSTLTLKDSRILVSVLAGSFQLNHHILDSSFGSVQNGSQGPNDTEKTRI